ncbi:MAG: recombinase family protein [Ruminococcus sp.]|nr:recombinase family protein [Ruminococcus sp.]
MAKGRLYGYARVSSKEQNLDRQIDALKKAGIDEDCIIVDKASGKDFEREGYQSFKSAMGLRDGDTLVIKSIDRLGRNKNDILREFAYWNDKGVKIKIIDIPTTMVDFPDEQKWVQDMINNIIMEVYTSLAEQERLTIRQRQSEGIAAAKKRGKHLGRPFKGYPTNFTLIYLQWKNKEMTAVKAMNILEIKKTAYYRYVNMYEEKKMQEPKLTLAQLKKTYVNNDVIYFEKGNYYRGRVVDIKKEKEKYLCDIKVYSDIDFDSSSLELNETPGDNFKMKTIEISNCHIVNVNEMMNEGT